MNLITKIKEFILGHEYEPYKSVITKKNQQLVIDEGFVKKLNLMPTDPRDNINDIIIRSLNEDSYNYIYQLEKNWRRDTWGAYHPTWFKDVKSNYSLIVTLDPFKNFVEFSFIVEVLDFFGEKAESFSMGFFTKDIPVQNIIDIGSLDPEFWEDPVDLKNKIKQLLKKGV